MSNLKDISDSEDNNDSNTNVINQDRPPELPPRPLNLLSLSPRPPPPHAPAYQSPTLPTPASLDQSAGNINHTCRSRPWYGLLFQKYVLLTVICGTLSIILGGLFITIYFIVRNTTTSLHYFETIPTYIPGVAMTITGLMVMLFSKTTHRKSCLVCFFIEIFPSIDINEILVVGQNLWLFLSPFISSLCSSDGHHDCDTHEQVNPSSCNLCKISCLQNS